MSNSKSVSIRDQKAALWKYLGIGKHVLRAAFEAVFKTAGSVFLGYVIYLLISKGVSLAEDLLIYLFVLGLFLSLTIAAFKSIRKAFLVIPDYKSSLAALTERPDQLLADFENSMSYIDDSVRLGSFCIYARGSERVIKYKRVREISLKWRKGKGYGLVLILEKKEFIPLQIGKHIDLLTKSQANSYFQPFVTDMLRHNPEIKHHLNEDEQANLAPVQRISQRPNGITLAEKKMRSFLRPKNRDFLAMLGLCIIPLSLVVLMFVILPDVSANGIMIFYLLFIAIIFILSFVPTLIKERIDFKKRMQSYIEEGCIDKIIDDYTNSNWYWYSYLKLGKQYVFMSGAGCAIPYKEIEKIRIRRASKYMDQSTFEITENGYSHSVLIKNAAMPERLGTAKWDRYVEFCMPAIREIQSHDPRITDEMVETE